MPVGQQQASLNIPSPSELAGGQMTPAVTPSAVTQMSEALRQGFLTADDIIARTGKRAQLKEKADVMALTEQMSPEAVQSRQNAMAATDVQSRLAQARGQAALPLVQPKADLDLLAIEEESATQKYGPGITFFKALSPGASISAPMTPDGKPDWAARAKIGIDLADRKEKDSNALARLTPDPSLSQKSADGNSFILINKFGETITQDLQQNLSRQIAQPFSQVAPGTVVTPAPAVAPAAPVTAPEVMPSSTAVPATKAIVEPAGVRTTTGISLGDKPEKLTDVAKDPSVELASLNEDLNTIKGVKDILATQNVVGPQSGNIAAQYFNKIAAAFGARTDKFQSQNELEIAVNKKVLEGAQKMKGNLSDKDIRFLQASYPSLSSAPATWNSFLDSWERMIRKNEEVLQGRAPKGSSVLTPAQSMSVLEPATAPPAATFSDVPTFNSQEEGVKSGVNAFRVGKTVFRKK